MGLGTWRNECLKCLTLTVVGVDKTLSIKTTNYENPIRSQRKKDWLNIQ